MNKIILSYEEWFKIYLILDNLDQKRTYNKNFLLFVEHWKQNLLELTQIYVSLVESLFHEHNSEIDLYNIEFSKIEGDEKLVTELQDQYSEVLQEHESNNNDVNSIVHSKREIESKLIPLSIVPELDSEIMEVLKPLLEGA